MNGEGRPATERPAPASRIPTVRGRTDARRVQRPPTPHELLATFREQGRHDLAALLLYLLDGKAAA